jgi:hypothetical protein
VQLVGDLAVANERIAHIFMIGHFEAQSLAGAFESVTEGTMPEVVDEACRQRLRRLRLFGRMHITANHLHQSTSGMEYADAVCKSRMRRSGIDEVREAKLLHASQPLKRARLHHAPKHVFQLHGGGVESMRLWSGSRIRCGLGIYADPRWYRHWVTLEQKKNNVKNAQNLRQLSNRGAIVRCATTPAPPCGIIFLAAAPAFSSWEEAPVKVLEIVPRPRAHLFGTLVDKEAAIQKNGRGTYVRVGRKSGSKARWRHKMYGGSVQLSRDPSETITARIRATAPEDERRLLSSFLGFVDRHSKDQVATITIHY